MKGFQNRGLEENAKCSRWHAHNIKWKHLILELKSSLHGSRDASYELMRSQVPESGSIWQPTAGLLTLIFSSVFRVESAFWWVQIFVLVGLLLGGQPVSQSEILQILPKPWLLSIVLPRSPLHGGAHLALFVGHPFRIKSGLGTNFTLESAYYSLYETFFHPKV